MALVDITTPLVLAKCHIYQDADTIAAFSSSEDADYPAENALDANTQLRARTTTGLANDGFLITLGTALTDACAVEVVNFAGDGDLPAGATARVIEPTINLNTGTAWQVLPSDVYSGQQFASDALIRPNLLAGFDTLPTPTKATPPDLVPFTINTLRVETQSGTDIGFVEVGFVAIGHDGRVIGKAASAARGTPQGAIQIQPADLLNAPGGGHRYTINWPYLVDADQAYIRELWTHTAQGAYPAFLFPRPGIKTNPGELQETWNTPEMRGGLVRLLSVTSGDLAVTGSEWSRSGVTLVAETWQEVPTQARM